MVTGAGDDRFELAAGVGGGTGKDLVRSVFQAGDARYVRRMFGYGCADRCISQGGCGAGQAPVPADGDPGMPVIRPACSGSVIREVVIRRAPERGLVPVPAVPGAEG
jgi:hypothetical protein